MFQADSHPLYSYTEQERQQLLGLLGLEESVLQESVDSIVDWFQKQPHLIAARAGLIHRAVVEHMLIIAKGSIEKTKQRIDGLYKYRALAPELVQNRENELDSDKPIWTFFAQVIAPQLYEGRRVSILTLTVPDPDSFRPEHLYKICMMLGDIRLQHDYASGDLWVLDLRHVSFGHVLRLQPLALRKASLIYHEGFAFHVNAVHVVNCSLASKVQPVLAFFRQFVNSKIMSRVHIHEQLEELYQHVPKDYLSEDLGGTLPTYDDFRAQSERSLREEQTRRLLLDMAGMVSEERLRPGGGDHLDPLAGSFKQLNFD